MAGLFAVSVNPRTYQDLISDKLFWGTFYQQHLGEEYGGLATYDRGRIKIRTHRGLFRPNFTNDLEGLEGSEGIGYCGSDREPFLFNSISGEFSLCFSGNIINSRELIDELEESGEVFSREDDVELIAHLITGGNLIENFKRMSERIKGTFSFLLLSDEGIYAAVSPNNHWPLVIGGGDDACVIASESGAFPNLGFNIYRDLEPGEIVLLKNGHWESKDKIPGEKIQICSFLWVYTAFPNAVIKGIPASLVRKRLGAALARRDIEKGFIPHVVAPVPDSGRFHAIGYQKEFCLQMMNGKIDRVPVYDELLLKYPYTGRSFTPQSQRKRDEEAQVKLLPSGENYQGKIVVVCDDSIVRGTQAQTNLVPKLRMLKVKEIHFRVSNPEIHSYCPWGKTTKKGEMLASKIPSKEERIKFLGIDSLEYNNISDLVEAIGLPEEQLCVDCSLNRE